jgi:hypothetical protein
MLSNLHGKTAKDVISEADVIIAERREKERQQALLEIQELETKRANADAARKELAKFEILKSRFYKQSRGFETDQSTIQLSVKNGTEHAISRSHITGTLATPGRSIPWLKEDFNYLIRGGLEPGESADWNLSPSMFGGWSQVEAKPDMVLTVEVIRLDGADEEPIYDASFSDTDEERLGALKAEFGQ